MEALRQISAKHFCETQPFFCGTLREISFATFTNRLSPIHNLNYLPGIRIRLLHARALSIDP
jgi:hypothetical protein